MRPPFYKRQYFINKELQGRYIFKYFLLFGLGSILFTLTISFFSSNTLSIVYEDYRLQLGTTPDILINKILSTQWFLIVVGGVAIVVITLLLTHRIAGPFFRYQKTLDEMMNKNLSYEIFLRKNDEGKELGTQINAVNKMLSSDFLQLMDNCNKINQLCSCCLSELNEDCQEPGLSTDLSKNSAKNIQQLNLETLSILSEYKLLKK